MTTYTAGGPDSSASGETPKPSEPPSVLPRLSSPQNNIMIYCDEVIFLCLCLTVVGTNDRTVKDTEAEGQMKLQR